jgi:YVTN family beta-propeller protein
VGVESKTTAQPGYSARSVSRYLSFGLAAFCGLTLLIEEKTLSAAPLQVTAWGGNFYGECNVPTNLYDAFAVAAGDDFSVAIRADHSVVAWGNNDIGQTNVPAGLSNVIAIAASHQRFALALKSDGTIVGWGNNAQGQLNLPTGLSDVTTIAVGNNHGLAVRSDGTVVAWGDNSYGQTNVPLGLTGVVAIAGYNNSMAVKSDGTVVAWGTSTASAGHVPPRLSNVIAIATGQHTLALKNDGSVIGWGDDNTYGQITVPPAASNIIAVGVGNTHSLALRNDGTLFDWGLNRDGQGSVPFGLMNVEAIAAGGNHNLALAAAPAITITTQPQSVITNVGATVSFSVSATSSLPLSFQWRKNGANILSGTNTTLVLVNAQLTDAGNYDVTASSSQASITSLVATLTFIPPPTIVTPPQNLTADVGANAFFSVKATGSLPMTYQWLKNGTNMNGPNSQTIVLPPVLLSDAGSYAVIVSSAAGSVTSAPGVLTVRGSFAVGSVITLGGPALPGGLSNIVRIAAGYTHALALRNNGTVVAWGDNTFGETQIPPIASNVVAVAAGNHLSLALKDDGTAIQWGKGGTGVLATGVTAVAAGNQCSVVLKNDGSVTYFGTNGSSFAGNNFVAIAAGSDATYSAALKNDGTVAAFGPTAGASGLQSVSNIVALASSPTHTVLVQSSGTISIKGNVSGPAGLSNVVAVAAGPEGSPHDLALRADGTVVGWGSQSVPSEFTNIFGISAGSGFSLLLGNSRPGIVTQPSSVTVNGGGTAVFSVVAAGAPPLTYQWQRNGTNIVGATNSTLTLNNVQGSDAGTYTVIVTSGSGSTVSIPVQLAVNYAYVNFEGKQTTPARLSPDGNRLFVVNTPDARLSVFDVSRPSNPKLIAEIPVGIEPVSVNPRTSNEAWVVNELSDSVSIVSVSQGIVTDTLYTPDEPTDVVFAQGKAFVTASRKNQILVFDATNHAQLTAIPVFGENPRAMAVSLDGSKVYAAFALSGNHTTLIPPGTAPPQPPPTNTNLPAPPTVGLIVDASDPGWTNFIQFRMPDNDVVEIDATTMAISRYFTNVGTINLGIAVRPDNGDLYVANTDARNTIRFEPALRGHAVDNRITRIDITTGARTNYDLNFGLDYSILPNLAGLSNALAQPTAIAFDSTGSSYYVASFGTDRIAKLDTNGVVIAKIEIGNAIGSQVDPRNKRGPRGLAFNAATRRLYVVNRISNTISIVDTTSDTLLKEIPVGSFDPTSTAIRLGRGFLYDTKLSGNGTESCASCHIDSEMDLLAWDLGDPGGNMKPVLVFRAPNSGALFPTNIPAHPMKGPLMTQTLRGLVGNEPFHWRGDKTNFLDFNVTFNTLMGGATLADPEMNAFRDFINTVTPEPNPNRTLSHALPTSLAGGNPQTGLLQFDNGPTPSGTCFDCHGLGVGKLGTDNKVRHAEDVQVTQNVKTPHLRNLYQKMNFNNTPGADSIGGFGFMHDGEQTSLLSFLSRPFFSSVSPANKTNIAALLLCFDNVTAQAVGYSRTFSPDNVNAPGSSSDWDLLEGQVSAGRIDLIVKGTLDGVRHGLLYRPSSNDYVLDSTNFPPLTRSQLAAKILAGDTMTFMGVPPGTGFRMGIDRNANGILDADEPPPKLSISNSGNSVTISWPYGALGYVLESAPALNSSWNVVTNPPEIVGAQYVLTSPALENARFYRLRSQ